MIPKKTLKRMSAREIASLAVCPNCGGKVTQAQRGPRSYYCSPKCRVEYNNRSMRDGAAIIKLAKCWRETRGAGIGASAFKSMTKAIDAQLEADREDGRPSACYGAAALLDQPTMYIDRRRRA